MIRIEADDVRAVVPSLHDQVSTLKTMVEARLSALAPEDGESGLAEAVRYALLAPGKRTRPIIALLCAERFGGEPAAVLDAACAFEMVHAASLVLDDLPCMDDASVRRGRQTVHRRFGEDTAVLTGVALLNEAFGVLARDPRISDDLSRRVSRSLSSAVGLSGLVLGQMRDLRERDSLDVEALLSLNHQKTGVLFCAAAETGAVIGGASEREAAMVCAFARHVGAAYQIRDDLLDGASLEDAGKDVGQDEGKPTFVSLLGYEGARRRLEQEKAAALQALSAIGDAGRLEAFSEGLLAVDWESQPVRLGTLVRV